MFSPIEQPYSIVWVKNYKEFTNYISNNGLPNGICFDHDLGDDHYDSKSDNGEMEKTGYDCAKWLLEYCSINNKKLPLFSSQSANPVGKKRILDLLSTPPPPPASPDKLPG